MPIERIERRIQEKRKAQWIEDTCFAAALLWHTRANVLPRVPKLGHVAARNVVGDRDARQFDNPTFDRVHQTEVADRPREQRALDISRATQEEGGSG